MKQFLQKCALLNPQNPVDVSYFVDYANDVFDKKFRRLALKFTPDSKPDANHIYSLFLVRLWEKGNRFLNWMNDEPRSPEHVYRYFRKRLVWVALDQQKQTKFKMLQFNEVDYEPSHEELFDFIIFDTEKEVTKGLTQRELAVFKLRRDGYKNQEISERLGGHEKRVSTQNSKAVKHIEERLDKEFL